MELPSVGDTQAAHAMSVAPFLEVLVERLTALVHKVAANLTRVLDAQSMKLVQPVRDRLSIPAKRQLERVVHLFFVFRIRLFQLDLLCLQFKL